MNDAANPLPILLLVEDNPADVVFFQEAMEVAEAPAALHVVGDGDEALRFLHRQGPFADAPRPAVIVLDLNLPVKNGQDVMRELAADPELSTIPVAILTTSTSERFVCDLYPQGRCLYFTKTVNFRLFQDIVRQIAAHAKTTRPGG